VFVSPVVPSAAAFDCLSVVEGEDDTAGVVLIVVVVVEDCDGGDVTTTPDGGKVTSPIGAESVGPLG
jgi:hypothetical protein